jgi:hypothetical protein
MKKLLIIALAFISLSSVAQSKPKESKDTTYQLSVGVGFTKKEFDRITKQRAKLDSTWQNTLLLFLEAKGVAITPELQILGYDKGNLTIKTKK